MKYDIFIGLKKALINTAVPNISALIVFLITNPAVISKVLDKWSEMTALEIALLLTNLAINWWKNKDLGKPVAQPAV